LPNIARVSKSSCQIVSHEEPNISNRLGIGKAKRKLRVLLRFQDPYGKDEDPIHLKVALNADIDRNLFLSVGYGELKNFAASRLPKPFYEPKGGAERPN